MDDTANSSAPAETSRPCNRDEALRKLCEEGRAAHKALSERYRSSRLGGFFPSYSDTHLRDVETKAMEERRLAKIVDAKRIACIPIKYRGAQIDDLTRIPLDCRTGYSRAIDSLCRAEEKVMIIALIGEIGGGKTHMACAVINEMVNRGRPARYTTAKEYIDAVRGRYGNGDAAAVEKEFTLPELLVIDELQMRGETPHEDNLLMVLIDRRYRAERSTILISNHADKAKFLERVDARTADRMVESGGIFVVDWPSIRGRLQG